MSDDWRWRIVREKTVKFDGVFYFGVKTTGIFCRPSCASKEPQRENVMFFDTVEDAERSNFRACLRCKPKSKYLPDPTAALIANAINYISTEEITAVDDLSRRLDVSAGHLRRFLDRCSAFRQRRFWIKCEWTNSKRT